MQHASGYLTCGIGAWAKLRLGPVPNGHYPRCPMQASNGNYRIACVVLVVVKGELTVGTIQVRVAIFN